MRPYFFCNDGGVFNEWNEENDNYYIRFEQDCEANFGHYDNFIYKIDLNDINVDRVPHEAGYYGDFTNNANELALAITVDEIGHITVAGYSNGQGFGQSPNSFGIFYLKTHWGIHYECDSNVYIGFKIRDPMKFNNANARDAGVFTTDLAAAMTVALTAYTPYPVNE